MKTIRVWANSNSTGIFDEIGSYILQENTTISDDTWNDLQKWVHEYEPYTSLSSVQIKEMTNKINELDEKGIELLKRIRSEWKIELETHEELKFLYRSELLGKNITVPED